MVLKISTVLSWCNLVIWGIISSLGILAALLTVNLSFLVITFLTGVAVLHSYAALQLHKSIKNSAVPLSNQTPVGIRFIGAIALFFGILYIGDGVGLLQNTREAVQLLQPKLPPQAKGLNLITLFRASGVFSLVCGISIALNVILNFRLLRWYFLMKGMV